MAKLFDRILLPVLALGALACSAAPGDNDIASASAFPYKQFNAEVYPVLLRDCGFHACHGAPERFFRVWGPGRARMDPLTRAFASPTPFEAPTNHELALSMIDADEPSRSLLLRKPLAVEAGGMNHGGIDKYGRNVYRTVNDAGYLAIARWVNAVASMTPPTMIPPPAP